jgi:hypothetical protein
MEETLHDKLFKIGFTYFDINPLTGNKMYQDKEENQIEILTDTTEVEE